MLAWRERQIRRLSAFPRLAAIAAALPWARPDEVSWLITELLELAVPPAAETAPAPFFRRGAAADQRRAADEALSLLARHWMLVPAELKPAALSVGRDRWPGAVRAVGPDAAAARGIAVLALDTLDPRLIPGLCDLLAAPGLQAALYVERSLTELVRRAAGLDPALVLTAGARPVPAGPEREAAPPGSTARAELEAHLARSATDFVNHRARGVIWCAVMVLEPATVAAGGPLAQWLLDKEQPSLPALRGVIRWSAKPLARLRAWEWLRLDHLATAAADRLTRAQSPREHELVLERAHLVLHPRRAARLRQIGGKTPGGAALAASVRGGVLPPPEMVEHLQLAARRNLPRLAHALHLGGEATRAALEPLLVDPEPLARHAAARQLGPRGLGDYLFDADRRVARSAALSLSAVGVPDVRRKARAGLGDPVRLFARLAASPHESLRAIAEQEMQRAAWDDPASVPGRIEARRRLHADRAGFLKDLHQRWADGTVARPRLVMLIRRLGLQAQFAGELEAVIREGLEQLAAESPAHELDPVARAVATAIAAVGEGGASSAELLIDAAHRGAGRVRANAVEAIGRLARQRSGAPDAAMLLEFKEDAHHRVRASVLRAFLTGAATGPAHASALEGLAGMLHDERPAHRTAGVWLADRTLLHAGRARAGERWPELASRIVDLARGDADPQVRRRAEAFALRLRHELKQRPVAAREVA